MKPLEQQSDAELLASLREAAELTDAPAPLVRAAIDLWPSTSAVGTALARLRAALAFDSWAAGPLALGLRGGTATARHMVFTVDGRDIDLRIDATRAGYVLTGQILGPDERVEIALRRATDTAPGLHAAIDDMGEFHFDPVPGGHYLVTLKLPTALVDLPLIEFGPRP